MRQDAKDTTVPQATMEIFSATPPIGWFIAPCAREIKHRVVNNGGGEVRRLERFRRALGWHRRSERIVLVFLDGARYATRPPTGIKARRVAHCGLGVHVRRPPLGAPARPGPVTDPSHPTTPGTRTAGPPLEPVA
jgi:hypothetical protein